MATDLQTPPPPAPSPATDAGGDDPFRRLHKMSTTAGVGAGDYVAINGAAIAAVLLGVASATVLFGSGFLLLIPLAGVVCAVLAWVQVGQSNGTQTGRGLAVLGTLLAVGFGGYEGAVIGTAAAHAAAARQQVVDLIHDFGQDIVHERYAAAYDRCDDAFRQTFPLPQFEGQWAAVRKSPQLGNLVGIEWNGQLQFEVDPTTGQQVGGGMVLLRFDKAQEPARPDMFFRSVNGTWKVDRIPNLFPTPTSSGRPQVMGPPKPAAK